MPCTPMISATTPVFQALSYGAPCGRLTDVLDAAWKSPPPDAAEPLQKDCVVVVDDEQLLVGMRVFAFGVVKSVCPRAVVPLA